MRPRWPKVSFWTPRRTSSMLLFARRITWNGSATWPAWGSATSKARRYAPERSSTPQVDALAPRLGLREQPPGGTRSVATRDKVEQLTPVHVHDRGAPAPGAPPPGAPEQGLIETQRLHRSDTVGVGGEQRLAPGEHRPVRRVPATTQLGGHIGDRAGVAAHRHSRPAPRPRRQRRPGRRDPLIDLGERPHHTVRRRTAPPPLAPHEAHRAPERRQVHQPHRAGALRPHRPAAAPTRWPCPSPDVQHQQPAGRIVDADDGQF